MKTRIHVNGQNLRCNSGKRPVFVARPTRGRARQGNRVVIHGPSELVYRPLRPLKSAAVAWIETTARVEVFK